MSSTLPKRSMVNEHDLQMAKLLCEEYSEICKQAGGIGATLKDFHGWLENALEYPDA